MRRKGVRAPGGRRRRLSRAAGGRTRTRGEGGASHGGGERRGDRKEEDAQRLKPKIKNCRVKRPILGPPGSLATPSAGRGRGCQTKQGPPGWGSAPPTLSGAGPVAPAAPAPRSVQISHRPCAAAFISPVS